ncbi:thioesterase domain-containing protein [candidate division KSB1 bacterium]|nr:thioesterase domain-containing protein [candidate division KSB1 bacterium]
MKNNKTNLNKVAEKYLYDHIPITRHLGVSVTCYDGQSINLSAPLSPNINHQGTVFGGSLVTVAILAGWTILHLKLMSANLNCRLVIQKSMMDFKKPVLSDFNTKCVFPDQDEWSKFINTLTQKGKARMNLVSEIYDGSNLAGKHTGTYVAVMNKE